MTVLTHVFSNLIFECDVQDDNSIDNFFLKIKENWNTCDFLVHSVAFSDKNEMNFHFGSFDFLGFPWTSFDCLRHGSGADVKARRPVSQQAMISFHFLRCPVTSHCVL